MIRLPRCGWTLLLFLCRDSVPQEVHIHVVLQQLWKWKMNFKISFAIICLKLDIRMFIMANLGIIWWWGYTWAGLSVSTNEKSCCTTSDQPNDRISRYMFRYLDLAYFCWFNCMLNAKISHFKIQPFFVFIGNFRCKYFGIKNSNILFSGLYFWSSQVSPLPQQASSLWQFCENKVKY